MGGCVCKRSEKGFSIFIGLAYRNQSSSQCQVHAVDTRYDSKTTLKEQTICKMGTEGDICWQEQLPKTTTSLLPTTSFIIKTSAHVTIPIYYAVRK